MKKSHQKTSEKQSRGTRCSRAAPEAPEKVGFIAERGRYFAAALRFLALAGHLFSPALRFENHAFRFDEMAILYAKGVPEGSPNVTFFQEFAR